MTIDTEARNLISQNNMRERIERKYTSVDQGLSDRCRLWIVPSKSRVAFGNRGPFPVHFRERAIEIPDWGVHCVTGQRLIRFSLFVVASLYFGYWECGYNSFMCCHLCCLSFIWRRV